MDFNWLDIISDETKVRTLVKDTQFTAKFGIQISEEDAKVIVAEGKKSLRSSERIEFGKGVTEKLIIAFCDSDYIYQSNFTETICELQELFYLVKNETMEKVSDDELIEVMEKNFNGICEGSIELLSDWLFEEFAGNVKHWGHAYVKNYFSVRDVEVEDE